MSKFYVGQQGVKTKSGIDVVILTTSASSTRPIIGYLNVGDSIADYSRSWTAEGYFHGVYSPCELDLITPKRKITHTIWVNVYEDHADPRETKDQAIRAERIFTERPLILAHPVTFTVEVDE